jgi:hypothetical protein
MSIRVVNVRTEKCTVYVGPGGKTKWSSPFVIGRDGSRAVVLKKYRDWVLSQQHLVQALPELKGQVLGCTCAPARCEGHVLIDLVIEHELGMLCANPKERL